MLFQLAHEELGEFFRGTYKKWEVRFPKVRKHTWGRAGAKVVAPLQKPTITRSKAKKYKCKHCVVVSIPGVKLNKKNIVPNTTKIFKGRWLISEAIWKTMFSIILLMQQQRCVGYEHLWVNNKIHMNDTKAYTSKQLYNTDLVML